MRDTGGLQPGCQDRNARIHCHGRDMHSMAWEVIRHSGPDWREAYQFWLFLRSSLWGDGELSCDELRCLNDLGKLRSRHHAASSDCRVLYMLGYVRTRIIHQRHLKGNCYRASRTLQCVVDTAAETPHKTGPTRTNRNGPAFFPLPAPD